MIVFKDRAYFPKKLVEGTTLRKIKKDLTIANPLMEQKAKLGLSLMGVAPSIKMYEVSKDIVTTPIGYAENVLQELPNFNSKKDLKDLRFSGHPINITFSGKLRPYQQKVIDALKIPTVGVISSPTGSGKSVMMCALIAGKNTTSLVLVNTLELAAQFKANLLKFTSLKDCDVNILSSGSKFKLGKVTVALLQSMHKMDNAKYDSINKHIGMVLTDEVHIVGADTYFAVLNKLYCKNKYGFSATPERDDGLTPLIYWASGNLREAIKIEELGNNVMKPTIEVVQTDYYYPLFDMSEYQQMITDLCSDPYRNLLISDTILSKYPNIQKVLLCGRVMQCIYLQELLPGSQILVGSISKEDAEIVKEKFPDKAEAILKQKGKKYRKKIVDRLISGDLRTVISTYKLFSTGLDFSGLELAGFCSPLKSKILVKQCRGRIMRVSKGKSPVCLDFEDKRVGLLYGQSKTRQRILRSFD